MLKDLCSLAKCYIFLSIIVQSKMSSMCLGIIAIWHQVHFQIRWEVPCEWAGCVKVCYYVPPSLLLMTGLENGLVATLAIYKIGCYRKLENCLEQPRNASFDYVHLQFGNILKLKTVLTLVLTSLDQFLGKRCKN